MKHKTITTANAEFEAASKFYRILPDGRRLLTYAEHTDGRGLNTRFWICLQERLSGVPTGWTVSGQKYLDRDGEWREPHGSKFRRHFSSFNAAAKFTQSGSWCIND
jgi:hypothetical protein